MLLFEQTDRRPDSIFLAVTKGPLSARQDSCRADKGAI